MNFAEGDIKELNAKEAYHLSRLALVAKGEYFKGRMMPLIDKAAKEGKFYIVVNYKSEDFIPDQYVWEALRELGYSIRWEKEKSIFGYEREGYIVISWMEVDVNSENI
jgi:hypothetical protein